MSTKDANPDRDELKSAASRIPTSPALNDERRQALENYLPDFLEEFTEQIDTMESCVMALEHNPGNGEELKNCFRQVHTLKGSANALGFLALGFLCHITESALVIYRDKNAPLPSRLVELLYDFNDALRRIKARISSSLTDSDVDIRRLVDNMEAATQASEVKTSPPKETEISKTEDPKPKSITAIKDMAPLASVLSVSEKIGAIRVEVTRLDSLMNSLVELALLRNRSQQLVHNMLMGEKTENLMEGFGSLASNLDSATRRLQSSVMRARMLPVGNVFNKFGRVVRDLSVALGKEADLVIHGAETELDKNLIETISDPLLHIIRNCMDHGIEDPDKRAQLGKPRRGSIHLNAFQEGNSIVVEISDDGKGIDPEALVDKAIKNGALRPEDAQMMSETQKLSLVFQAGLSTASAVTDVSGRGVGMDVVKTNLEKLNGDIDIKSQPGSGTRIILKIPLTLAIIPTLLCRVGRGVFGVPLFSVEETIRVTPSELENREYQPQLMFRNERLPVVILKKILKFEHNGDGAQEQMDVVVVKSGLRRIGMAVDKTLGQEEVLIKSLDSFRGIFDPPYLSGATILGDGSIAFILDISKLAATVQFGDTRKGEIPTAKAQAEPEELALIFGDDDKERYAVAARWIGGVTLVNPSDVQLQDGRKIIASDYGVLPVTRIPATTPSPSIPLNDMQYLVVFRKEGRRAGLMVNEVRGLRNLKVSKFQTPTMGKDQEEPLMVDDRPTKILDPDLILESALSSDQADKP